MFRLHLPHRGGRLFLSLFILGCLGFAQEFRSTLNGRVTDPAGAAVVGAKVVAVERDTGARSEATSGAEGEYTLPFLTPGRYTLTAESPGFKRYVQEGIQIGTNTRVTQEIKLELGSQAESVTVVADATLLTTASASVGQVIGQNIVENIPMNGRTPLTLAQLAFGVTPASDPRFTRPFDNAGPSGFSMGGGQAQSNELLIDGVPDTTRNRRVAYNPPVDAVSEVKVEAFQPDAAYGNTAGGTVNVVMKGGTNELHGTLYLFNQVSALKAAQFFTNAASQRKPVTRFNQYGGTVGGPIWIPKLINGKDKLFFFFSYEGIKQSEPEPTFSTVMTAEQRNGNFSGLLAAGSIYQLYDPFSGRLENNLVRRDPFPNNIIPANRISPVARNILNYYPLPNTTGRADGRDNFFSNAVRSDNFFSYMGRFDWNVSDVHKLFFNMRTNDRIENRGNRFDNIVTGNNLIRINWGFTFDDVYTISPTLIMNTRIGWTRFNEGNIRPHDGFDFTSLGFPASLTQFSDRRVFPRIELAGGGTPIGDSAGGITPFDTIQYFQAFTKIVNRHTVKFGADLRRSTESSNNFGNSSGRYEFNQNWTRGPLITSPTAPNGQDAAALLMGIPTGGNWQINATRTQQAYYYAGFIQDDWRVTNSMTLNLGLRYEFETGQKERWDRALRGFAFGAENAVTAPARAAYAAAPSPLLPVSQFNPVGGAAFVGGSNPRTVYDTYPAAWAPRFGWAWTPAKLGGKTVIRGGIGLFYQTLGVQPSIQQPGFSQQTPLTADINQFLSPVFTLSNPFNEILRPVGNSLGVNTFLGQNLTFFNTRASMPQIWRWNFNIQREISKNLVTEIGYMGSRGARLPENRDLNFIPLEFLSTSPVRDQANINRLTANVPNPFRGLLPGTSLNGNNITTEQLLRPYPHFNGQGGVRMEGQFSGYSRFHQLMVRLEKRYSNGLQFLANYSWQKMLEAVGRLNAADPFYEYRIADEDRPHRFIISGSYDLPFGKGRKWLASAGGFTNRVVTGWQINAIWNVQSGAPVEWGNVIYTGGDLNWSPRNLTNAFNRDRFIREVALQLDRNRRTFGTRYTAYRADGVNNVDLSVIKNIPILTDRGMRLQLRFEAFNAFNRAQFNAPNLSPTDTNFARITSQANLNRAIQMAGRFVF
jgi:hypothetical protein